MIRFLRAPLGAACGVLLLTAAALASPAILRADTVLRQGPGPNQPIAWTLNAGTHVDVLECQSSAWCLIDRRGKTGWVDAEDLDLYPGRKDVASRAEAAAADAAATERARRIASSGGNGGSADPGPKGNPNAARMRDALSRKEPDPLPGVFGNNVTDGYEDVANKAALGGVGDSGGSTGNTAHDRLNP
jgi:hypothetical protein